MKKFKQNAAITLIALVITIIILLILAGVALSTLVNNGLFEKAKLAKEVSAYTSAKEIVSMKLMEIAMNKKGTCTIEDIAKSMKNADNITIEKYYNEDVALIKTGITENLINLKSIVVSVNEYSKYKFLIGQSTLIEGVLNEEITDTTPADKFKDTDKFEDDLFGKTIETPASSKQLSYSIKNNSKNTTKQRLAQVIDSTENNNNVNLYNIEKTEDGKGIVFNGTSSYAELDINQDVTFPITIEMDLKTNKKQTNNVIYMDPKTKIGFGMYNSHFIFTCKTSAATATVPSDFFDGNLKHIVITYSSLTKFELYINGQKITKSSSTDYWNAGIVTVPTLGKRNTDSGSWFNGSIYNFKIYNRILEESEMNGTENKENIVLEYNMEDGTSYETVPDTLKDMVNNNDATMYYSRFNSKKDGIIFDGKSSYAELNLQQELTFPMTVEISLRIDTKQSNASIIYLEPNSKTAFGIYNNSYFILSISTYTATVSLPADFYDGNLKHIVITYNSLTNFELYINGEKMKKNTSKTDSWHTGVGTVPYLGRRSVGNYFNGTIHELNIYKDILSDDEIGKQYEYMKNNY